jgi:hypothetical protein
MAAYIRRRAGVSTHTQGSEARRRTSARLRPPPTAALIDAVLEFADLRDEMGGGRVMLRLSPARAAEPRAGG